MIFSEALKVSKKSHGFTMSLSFILLLNRGTSNEYLHNHIETLDWVTITQTHSIPTVRILDNRHSTLGNHIIFIFQEGILVLCCNCGSGGQKNAHREECGQ